MSLGGGPPSLHSASAADACARAAVNNSAANILLATARRMATTQSTASLPVSVRSRSVIYVWFAAFTFPDGKREFFGEVAVDESLERHAQVGPLVGEASQARKRPAH